MNFKKTCYIILGCTGVAFGALGAVLPMLPTIPFLMLAAFCFTKSSERLDQWFRNTKLYKNNLEDYVAGHGMTWKCKSRIMLMITLLMCIGFVLMGRKGIVSGCAVLGIIWLLHVFYFCFAIKTIPMKKKGN